VLWPAGLRISEALALSETDIDPGRGSVLVRHGKCDKRREAGMDQFGFDRLAAWQAHRVLLPPGPLFCVIDGQTRGRRWSATSARAELRELAAVAGVRRRFAPHQLRHAHAVELAREGVAVNIIQRQLGYADLDLPAGDRPLRDHQRGPLAPTTDDPMSAGLDLWAQAAVCRLAHIGPAKRQTKPERSSGDGAAAAFGAEELANAARA
jgi:integrase-like protein